MSELLKHTPDFIRRVRAIKNIALSSNYGKDVDPTDYEERVLGRGREQLASRVTRVLSEIVPPVGENGIQTSVLDLAAGTGLISNALADKGYVVTATDLSEPALSFLQQRNSNVDVVLADMNKGLPFGDESFDSATTVWANRFITDSDELMSEVHRILKPGGVFVWPVFPAETLIWKQKTALNQHTWLSSLSKDLIEVGFSEVERRRPNYREEWRTGEIPPSSIPGFIIARK